MQKKPNTKLRGLLKSKKSKTLRVSELSKTETSRLAKLNAMLDELRRGKNVQKRLRVSNGVDDRASIAARSCST